MFRAPLACRFSFWLLDGDGRAGHDRARLVLHRAEDVRRGALWEERKAETASATRDATSSTGRD